MNPLADPDSKVEHPRGLYKAASNLNRLFMQLAAVAAPIGMAALLTLGGAEIYNALYSHFSPKGDGNALKHAIKSLEYIFIAPLPVLLTIALDRYVLRFYEGKSTDEEKMNLMEVKALQMGLLAAAAATGVVARLIKDEGNDWEMIVSGTFAVLVLAGIFLGIEMLSTKMENDIKRSHEDNKT